MNRKGQSPVSRVAKHLCASHIRIMLWYWAIFIIAFVIVSILLNNFGVIDAEEDMLQSISYSPKIFLLVLGILLIALSMPSYVTNGITRKHFAMGTMLTILILSVVCAIIQSVGVYAGAWIYDLLNMEQNWAETALFPSLINSILMYVLYFTYGWLIGSSYYRFGWMPGTGITIVAGIVVIAMEKLLEASYAGGQQANITIAGLGKMSFYIADLGFAVVHVIILVAALLLGAANYYVLRNAAIRRKII
ncbi:hypothetical protein M6D81_24095 [Paenibacillus sp. J5C_2022]|uniref:hypothetical protein n=1 Tax=Paenibacillus sp. J5C2022 TaxID=2977129 RepID=UPI0021D32BF2|nr:hypothetical protein [Paenibacillus sp. J5C2022]MCU6711786.1 hypothetical protein [Paenibacillus sp. J5C2022]